MFSILHPLHLPRVRRHYAMNENRQVFSDSAPALFDLTVYSADTRNSPPAALQSPPVRVCTTSPSPSSLHRLTTLTVATTPTAGVIILTAAWPEGCACSDVTRHYC